MLSDMAEIWWEAALNQARCNGMLQKPLGQKLKILELFLYKYKPKRARQRRARFGLYFWLEAIKINIK